MHPMCRIFGMPHAHCSADTREVTLPRPLPFKHITSTRCTRIHTRMYSPIQHTAQIYVRTYVHTHLCTYEGK